MLTTQDPEVGIGSITVRLAGRDGIPRTGTVSSASYAGVVADFPVAEGPEFPIGFCGVMVLAGCGGATIVAFTITERNDAHEIVTYTFAADLSNERTWGFSQNRRGAFRITPAEEIMVSVSAHGRVFQGRLMDISRTGAAVVLDRSVEDHFCTVRRLTLRLRLPSAPQEEIELRALAPNRSAHGDSVRYGLHFIDDGTPDCARAEARLLAYVASRKVEVLLALNEMLSRA
jgi:hypothetical protein